MGLKQGFMRHIEACTEHQRAAFVPFSIEGRQVGSIRRDHAARLSSMPGFLVEMDRTSLRPATPAARTGVLAEAAKTLSKAFEVPLTGEIYPVIEEWGDAPLAHLDRAAIPWFGVRGFGVHANGYVRKPDGLHLWIGRRALDRRIDPGKLDTMIGGGLPDGYGIRENLEKEAWEEAGLAPGALASADATHALRYKKDMMKGVRNDTLFVYDLDLTTGPVPRNTDGEVDGFELMPAKDVMELVAQTDSFKFNCSLILIDFFLRHGLIDPAHPEFEALDSAFQALRSPFQESIREAGSPSN